MSAVDLPQILDLIPLPAFFCSLRGDVLIRNGALVDWLGTAAHGERAWLDQLPAESRAMIQAWLTSGAQAPFEGSITLQLNGARRLVEIRMTPHRGELLIGAIGTFTDVTEVTHQRESLQQMAAVFASATEGVLITDADMCILNINAAFTEVTGYCLDDVIGQTPRILSSGRHSATFYRAMWKAMNRAGHWRGEIWNRRKNGELYPEELSITALHDAAGEVTHFVGVFTDISQLRATQERADYLASHDSLTELANRRLFEQALAEAVAQHQWQQARPALVLINIARFHDINHSYGHGAGDALLREIAGRLVAWNSAGASVVARLGGTNFGLLLEDAGDCTRVGVLIDELLIDLRRPLRLANGMDLVIDAAAGIALCPTHGRNVGDLLRFADSALAVARAEAGHGYRFYETNFTDAARSRLSHESRLRRAIDNGDIEVHFQPQVDVRSGTVVGAEALARWHDPDLGQVPPDRFVALAEETGLILPLDELVLASACRQWADLIIPSVGPLALAVNISAAHFAHPGLTNTVTSILSAVGLSCHRLELEITETALMSQQETALATMHRLREAGIQLAIDDFGTGHSSLAYLRHFPLDKLKIDRQFVRHIPANREDRAIARAIIQLGHALGFIVLAEGVETPEQLAFLATEHCDTYQGWLCAKAMPAAELQQLLLASGETETKMASGRRSKRDRDRSSSPRQQDVYR